MGVIEIALIGVGLSMDAFAVSICKGLAMPRLNKAQALVIALFFGGFQALMPAIGWLLGTQLEAYITAVDHWIAFVLLAFIGGKMLWDSFHEQNEDSAEKVSIVSGEDTSAVSERAPQATNALDVKELFMLAIATSIDALAVGSTVAFLHVSLLQSIAIIGLITFALSFVGVVLGHMFGSRYERPAQIVGGVVLVCIGAKILLEHLGIL